MVKKLTLFLVVLLGTTAPVLADDWWDEFDSPPAKTAPVPAPAPQPAPAPKPAPVIETRPAPKPEAAPAPAPAPQPAAAPKPAPVIETRPVPAPAPQPAPVVETRPAAPPAPVEQTTVGADPRAAMPPEPAPNRPTLAVYMAGEEPQKVRGVHSILGGELARTISESEKYLAVDRTDAILEALSKEHIYQRSGSVSDEEIKSLGRQLGADYLCISNINAVGKRSYYLDIRLVDVVTAEITRTATATSNLKDASEMTRVARDIAYELIETEKARERHKKRKKILLYTSVGLDILGAGMLAYGYLENNNVIRQIKNDDGPEASRAATRRDAVYMASGVILASGVTLHIFF